MKTETTDWVEEVGAPAYASIVEMVAALQCDRDRLEELEDEREGWESSLSASAAAVVAAYAGIGRLSLISELAEEAGLDQEEFAAASDEMVEAGINATWSADQKCYIISGNSWGEQNPEEAEELKELELATTLDGEVVDAEAARERIQEDALSVRIFGERVDGEWQADRFELLLTTGGPAVRIMGELDGNNEPDRAWLEVQDWGKPWTQYIPADQETLLAYCRCFCFE